MWFSSSKKRDHRAMHFWLLPPLNPLGFFGDLVPSSVRPLYMLYNCLIIFWFFFSSPFKNPSQSRSAGLCELSAIFFPLLRIFYLGILLHAQGYECIFICLYCEFVIPTQAGNVEFFWLFLEVIIRAQNDSIKISEGKQRSRYSVRKYSMFIQVLPLSSPYTLCNWYKERQRFLQEGWPLSNDKIGRILRWPTVTTLGSPCFIKT